MKQVETHLLQRHYDGFLKKGKLRGRQAAQGNAALAGATELKNVGVLYAAVLIMLAIGLSASLIQFLTK